MRRWRWGSIAMAGSWVHTVHSAHGQMEHFFVVMLAKWSINSGSIVSTGLEFPQATVSAEPWVSLSELAIIWWNDCLEARIGIVTWDVNIWEFLQDSTSANKSQAESTEAIIYLLCTTSSATLSRYCSSPSDCIQLILMDLSTRQTQASLHLHWQCGLLMRLQ